MMTYREDIRSLCHEHTNFSESDIDFLIQHADSLMINSNYENEDVFIDVKNVFTGHATVIFHKKPTTRSSLYLKKVVGDIASLENEPGVHRTLHTGVPTIGLTAISQEGIKIQQTVFPIFRENKILGTLILERDAKDDALNHLPLKKTLHENYEMTPLDDDLNSNEFSFLEHIDDAILVFNDTGNLYYYNELAAEMYRLKLGYHDSLDSLHYDNLVLGNHLFKDIKEKWNEHQKRHYFSIAEFQYGSYYFLVKQFIISETQSVVVVCKDVTDIKHREAKLLITEAVLREMNHRIKNNLQTVVSLMRLQASSSPSEEVKKSLYDSLNRVLAISMTHELLTNHGEETVNLKQLIDGLMKNLQRCFQGQKNVEFNITVPEDLYLDSSRSTALSLIINELVQNSYDHAFKKKIKSLPKIELHIWKENDIIFVEVTDNGSGYQPRQLPSGHLGLMLVDRFVKSKLLGKLVVQSDKKGTRTLIKFKN